MIVDQQTNLVDSAPAAAAEDVPPTDDRFVPIRSADLAVALARDAERFGADAATIRDVADALADVLHQEAEAFRRDFVERYAAVNPDRDTLPTDGAKAELDAPAYADLERRVAYLLDKANFEHLTGVQLEAALQRANSLGVRVRLDPERVERLRIWVRGLGMKTIRQRLWWNPLKVHEREVEMYRRLAVFVRLRGDRHVHLKLFKDIPAEDVEALLPHAEVGMNLFDQLKLFGSGAGALGTTVWKVIQAITVGTSALFALAWIVVVGFVTLGLKTFSGYRAARTKRDSLRTRHLYFQNLANNAGVAHTLLAMIVEEETKEALLAYAFCRAADEPPRDLATLDRAIEAYLAKRFGVTLNFDAEDACETLTRLSLRVRGGALQVVDPRSACASLREHWSQRASWRYHLECVAARPARLSGNAEPAQKSRSAPRTLPNML